MKWRYSHRRKNIFGGMLLLGFTLCTIGLWETLKKHQEVSLEMNVVKETKSTVIHYTLASLDQVINSLVDRDLQRALANYDTQHQQIPQNTPQMRIIIASTWRSGSTLLGEILSSFPGIFYHYEPLMMFGMNQIRSGPLKDESQRLIQTLLQCNYTNEEEYLKFAFSKSDLFKRNQKLWTMCSAMPRFKCYMPEFLNKICSIFPVHLVKLVRLRLDLLRNQLSQPNTRVIWLVRDPRGTISSRKLNVEWCKAVCLDPHKLCSDLNEDFNTFMELKREFPGQIMVVRYEDLARDPFDMSSKILNFSGLFMHPHVEKYLEEHLTSEFEAPWSTIHDPQKRVGRWMKVTPWNDIFRTQYACRNELKLLGYRKFETERELRSGNAVTVLNVP